MRFGLLSHIGDKLECSSLPCLQNLELFLIVLCDFFMTYSCIAWLPCGWG